MKSLKDPRSLLQQDKDGVLALIEQLKVQWRSSREVQTRSCGWRKHSAT
jgi:hypothetical protein